MLIAVNIGATRRATINRPLTFTGLYSQGVSNAPPASDNGDEHPDRMSIVLLSGVPGAHSQRCCAEGYRRFVAGKRGAFEDELDAEKGVAIRQK